MLHNSGYQFKISSKGDAAMKYLSNSLVVFSFVFLFINLASAQSTWTPEMQIKSRAVASPHVSPDGTRVVYTVSDAMMTADRSEYVSQVWLATSDGKETYQLT